MARIHHVKTLLPSALALLVAVAACSDDSTVGAGGSGGSSNGGSGGAGAGNGGSGGSGNGSSGNGSSGNGSSGNGGFGGSGNGGFGGSGNGGFGGSGNGGSGNGGSGGSGGSGSGNGGSGNGSSGNGGSGGGVGGSGGGVGGAGGAPFCAPGSVERCYEGPAGTEGLGICTAGHRTCAGDGSGYGPCEGQVTPGAEDCATPVDDDCDGQVNEADAGCLCAPGSTDACYSGPAGTRDVGACTAGQKVCGADGMSFGPCVGEVVPAAETCTTAVDDDCDGQVNEDGAGCACVPDTTSPCYSGAPGTEGVGPCVAGTQQCNAAGTGYGPCLGEVTPALETCATPIDDDCDGQVNEDGAGCVCVPDTTAPCYSGPPGTQGVGACAAGTMTCNALGTGYGACAGEVTPAPETCATPVDDDCDGQVNEEGAGCVCVPDTIAPCYSGAPGTEGVGLCRSGTRTCNASGTGYGACAGEITPVTEACGTPDDDDCDGQINEGCTRYAADVQPIFERLCAPCHTTGSSAGLNVRTYATTQLAAANAVCVGRTKGACTQVRIQSGAMPRGRGCTGNPATDAANASCLTAAEQATVSAWITGGQLP